MVGGELTLEALDLSYNPSTGFYRAPVQAVANGGVLVIDDFGRQQVPPRDLLNRWIVPLESRVDFLTLQSGQKFELPFMVLVVFATNIKPAELVDEAFLRRIHYKVFAESPTVADFMQIFENCCRERQLQFDRDARSGSARELLPAPQIPLRGCQPRDLIDQALSLAEYLGRAPRADARTARGGVRQLLRGRTESRSCTHSDHAVFRLRPSYLHGAARGSSMPCRRRPLSGGRRPSGADHVAAWTLGSRAPFDRGADSRRIPGGFVTGPVLRRRQAAFVGRGRPAVCGGVGRRESLRAPRDRRGRRGQPWATRLATRSC